MGAVINILILTAIGLVCGVLIFLVYRFLPRVGLAKNRRDFGKSSRS